MTIDIIIVARKRRGNLKPYITKYDNDDDDENEKLLYF